MSLRRFEKVLIGAVAFHSCVLGCAMLIIRSWTLRIVGWEYSGPLFFPSQSGIFLLILGAAYAGGHPVQAFCLVTGGLQGRSGPLSRHLHNLGHWTVHHPAPGYRRRHDGADGGRHRRLE